MSFTEMYNFFRLLRVLFLGLAVLAVLGWVVTQGWEEHLKKSHEPRPVMLDVVEGAYSVGFAGLRGIASAVKWILPPTDRKGTAVEVARDTIRPGCKVKVLVVPGNRQDTRDVGDLTNPHGLGPDGNQIMGDKRVGGTVWAPKAAVDAARTNPECGPR